MRFCSAGADISFAVAADAGSSYEPYPKVSMYWDSDNRSERSTTPILDRASVDLGPHPSDPLSGSTMPSVHSSQPVDGMKTRADAQLEISGQDIYVYAGTNGFFLVSHLTRLLLIRLLQDIHILALYDQNPISSI